MAKSKTDNQSAVIAETDADFQAQIALLISENEILKVQLEAMEVALIEKEAELKEARTIKETSSVKINTATNQAPSVPTDIFTVEGKKYRFKKAGFIIGEKRYKAVEALEDDALLVKLIDYPSVVEIVE